MTFKVGLSIPVPNTCYGLFLGWIRQVIPKKIRESFHPVCDFGSNLYKKDRRSGERSEREKKHLRDDDHNRKMNKLLSEADGAWGSARLTLRLLTTPPPVSPHLSTITPFQHRSISLHHFISGQITYKPPFIHLSLSVSAVALSLPICSSISPPSGTPQSAGSILFCQRERAPLCIGVSHM